MSTLWDKVELSYSTSSRSSLTQLLELFTLQLKGAPSSFDFPYLKWKEDYWHRPSQFKLAALTRSANSNPRRMTAAASIFLCSVRCTFTELLQQQYTRGNAWMMGFQCGNKQQWNPLVKEGLIQSKTLKQGSPLKLPPKCLLYPFGFMDVKENNITIGIQSFSYKTFMCLVSTTRLLICSLI